MSNGSCCPEREVLMRLAMGQSVEGDNAKLELHFLKCDTCARMLEETIDDDGLVDMFRPADGNLRQDGMDSDVIQQVVDRGKLLLTGSMSVRSVASTIDSLLPPENSDEIGRLGRYSISRVLAAGGMGVLFKAIDHSLNRDVAVKVMRPEVAASPSARDRFLREAQAIGAIDHDNIVQIYEVNQESGVPYIVMQLLKGASLHQQIEGGREFTTAEVLRIGRETAEGLSAVHRAGVVHRDVKPENIWLQQDSGRVKLLDFGLARQISENIALTRSGDFLGTPAFMSPEQARGEEVDFRCDLFSLGVVLYRLAAGVPPFTGQHVAGITMSLAEKEFVDVRALAPNLPVEFAKLIMQLLQKDREDRPVSSEHVALSIATIEERPSSAGDELHVKLEESSPQRQADQPDLGRRRNGRRRLGAAVAVVATVLFGLLFSFRSKEGTVFVEVPGDISVREIDIDGKSVEFFPDDSGDLLKFSVGAGSYQLAIKTSDGLELKTTLGAEPLEIKAKQKVVLRAWKEVTTDKVDSVQPEYELTERQISAHLLSLPDVDVRVDLNDPDGRWIRTVTELDALPNEPFQVASVNLNAETAAAFSAADLHVVGQAGNLQSFAFESWGADLISTNAWKRFFQSPAATSGKLVNLNIRYGATFSDDVIESLNMAESLIYLRMSCPLSDEGLVKLRLPALQQLSLSHMPRVSHVFVERIPEKWPSISVLSFININLSRADLSSLAQLPLTHLNIDGGGLKDEQLAPLSRLSSLHEVGLAGNEITTPGLRHIKEHSLKVLRCDGTLIDDQACIVLSRMKTLESLFLIKCMLTDEGISQISTLPHLRQLYLGDTEITDKSLDRLATMKSLEELDLRGCLQITESAVRQLEEQLPECTVYFGEMP